MTDELFRDDATLLQCSATITAVTELGIVLDRTVFYPQGGGQACDTGRLQRADGASLAIVDTREGPEPGQILHLVAPGTDLSGWAAGQAVVATIDADRRQAHRRFHTATHLLCALVPHPVDGCSITDAELDANPGLVRSMSVQPPRGSGRVRLVEVQGVDLQPCGGTHVANTAEIGAVVVTKIEKKSAKTRRVVLGFAEPS